MPLVSASCSAGISIMTDITFQLAALERRKIAMLPICIGISGLEIHKRRVYRRKLLADFRHASLPPTFPLGALAVLSSGLFLFRRRIGKGKRPGPVKLLKFALGLSQPIRDRPQHRGVDAEPEMTGKMHLDVFRAPGWASKAGSPVHDAIGAAVDRRGRHRQIAG